MIKSVKLRLHLRFKATYVQNEVIPGQCLEYQDFVLPLHFCHLSRVMEETLATEDLVLFCCCFLVLSIESRDLEMPGKHTNTNPGSLCWLESRAM